MPIPTNANATNQYQTHLPQSQQVPNERKRRRPKRFKLKVSPAKKQRLKTNTSHSSGDANSNNEQSQPHTPTQPAVAVQQPRAKPRPVAVQQPKAKPTSVPITATITAPNKPPTKHETVLNLRSDIRSQLSAEKAEFYGVLFGNKGIENDYKDMDDMDKDSDHDVEMADVSDDDEIPNIIINDELWKDIDFEVKYDKSGKYSEPEIDRLAGAVGSAVAEENKNNLQHLVQQCGGKLLPPNSMEKEIGGH